MFAHRSKLAGIKVACRMLETVPDDLKSFIKTLDEPMGVYGPPPAGCYQRAMSMLGGRKRVKVERNAYLALNADETISLTFHATDILVIKPDDTVVIDFGDGDYKTPSTIQRMNMFLPPGYSVTRRYKIERGSMRRWGTTDKYYTPGTTEEAFWDIYGIQVNPGVYIQIPANSGDTIHPDGRLETSEAPRFKKVRRSNATPANSPPLD